MNGKFSWDLFRELPVIGILRGFSSAEVEEVAAASARGGLTCLEVTMNTAGAEESIRIARKALGGSMNIGAGTVCTRKDLDLALGAGAEFIVTPVLVEDVIEACRRAGVPVIAGALTPTEIHRAWQLGADLVKVFPADQLGPGYLRSVKAPLPDVRLVPTGGVTVETLAEYKRAGADGFGVGSPLFHRDRVSARDWKWVEEQARRFAEAYRRA